MSNLRDGYGNIINLDGGNGKQFYSGDYKNNLRNVFAEDFKTANADFTLSNCNVSANGLVGAGFCKAEHNKGTTIDYQKVIAEFVYSADAVLGAYLGDDLAKVDTANKTLTSGYGWGGSTGSVSYPHDTAIPFDFVSGEHYTITLEKTPGQVVQTLCRLKTGETVSYTVAWGNSGAAGVVCFSGNANFTKLSYYAPIFNHAKCLIVGDSITQGDKLSDKTKRYCWLLSENFFHNDCVISGINGTRTSEIVSRAKKLMSMGYSFDYIIVAAGTNDLVSTSGISAFTTAVANYIAELEATGAKVFWGIPPMRSSYAEQTANTQNAILAVPNIKALRFDLATQGNDGLYDATYFADGTHPNAVGCQRMFEFAVRTLELFGV